MKSKTYFEICKTWQEALDNTSENLMPIAIKLKLLTEEIDFIPDPEYTTDSKFLRSDRGIPFAAICMSTRFLDPDYDGKWSHCYLEQEVRQDLAEIVYQTVGTEAWVFFSQKWED